MIQLSDNELQIMNIVWKNGIVTSHQIIQNLSLKPNSIRTHIQRLLKKQAIIIYQKEGKQNLYQSNLEKKFYIKQITKEFVQKCILLECEK